MIASLLIANRGEIACRVIRTARRLGIRTVAVYSDADTKALHVRMADEAVHIGPSPARESYLCGDKIIEAAKQTGAEAIHPGYGFLSENADFAQAVIDAGLIWVGPKPASIRAMGLKDAAKKLMMEAGVPVTPGYLGEDQDPKRLEKEADAIGYPVLIKAVAGGGGKGMRRVDTAKDFDDALDSCKREAASSFGDDRVLIEKYILSPRHIEVQVFGDSHGNVVHLFERDCSLQRRHQKVIEEAPAPGMDAETREAVCGAAVRAAQAVQYENAGTIEFIADASESLRADRIWFMEMNTRLQVEHPVTEEITGQDLVEWQLRVASGEELPKTQDELSINGHAIEARLYAEDPAKGFLPSVGKIGTMHGCSGDRFETGVEVGSEVSPFYDPMIAKMVTSGPTREDAISELIDACETVYISPIKTNAWFLRRLLLRPEFQEGDFTTAFITEHLEELTEPPAPSRALLAAAASVLARKYSTGSEFRRGGLFGLSAFRVNAPSQNRLAILINGTPIGAPLDEQLADDYFDGDNLWWMDGEMNFLAEEGAVFSATLTEPRGTGTTHGVHDGEIEAPMPGRVTAVEIAAGDKVAKGQRLLTLEAMKMEHALTAPFDGTVAELNAAAGQQVSEGQLLVKIEAAPT
ncbi:MAG: acetyl/propionyl/methylcrotonyl-CoA carboxylase subunit alpha [Pseudomonadota bacterium]